MKTREQIINETVEFYNEDVNRRAHTDEGCLYKTDDGRRCAVGRCMKNPSKQWKAIVGTTLRGVTGRDLDQLLKKEYTGHPEMFWRHLQTLHDLDENWNEDGLSRVGKNKVLFIKSEWV